MHSKTSRGGVTGAWDQIPSLGFVLVHVQVKYGPII